MADHAAAKVIHLHIEVPVDFHTRIKMQCVMGRVTLQAYALAALEEKMARGEKVVVE